MVLSLDTVADLTADTCIGWRISHLTARALLVACTEVVDLSTEYEV